MTLIYLWIYTLVLVFLWVMFIFSKLHAYKFKAFSSHIEKVTKVVVIYLVILSVLWYIIIIFWTLDTWSNIKKFEKENFNFNEVNY